MEKQYRPFQEDDIIEKGDQIRSSASMEWIDFYSGCFGEKINPFLVSHSRKLIKSSDDVTISQPKETWTRDEVVELLEKCFHAGIQKGVYQLEAIGLNTWLKDNLK